MSRQISLVAVGVACLGGFYLLASWIVTPVALAESGQSGEVFQVADFLYQISLTEAYWSGVIQTPYAAEDQARVLSEYFGSGGGLAMSHGMSPVTLVLWYPFTLYSRTHPSIVYSIWLAICFAVFTLSLARAYGLVATKRKGLRIFLVAAILAVTASRVGWRAFALGQSAPLAATGLILLVVHLGNRNSADASDDPDRSILLLAYFLVLWKLHYIALAGGLHLMLGRPRRAVAFATAAAAFAVGIPSIFDPTLLASFIDQLTHFAGRGFTSEYAHVGQASAGGSGVTLRTVLRDIMSDRVADGASWGVFGVSMLALVGVRLRGIWTGSIPAEDERDLGSARPVLAVLFVAAVLVLLPYLGRYDDLFLVVVAFLTVVASCELRSSIVAVAAILLLALACLFPAPDLGGSPARLLSLKSSGLLLLFWLARAVPKTTSPLLD